METKVSCIYITISIVKITLSLEIRSFFTFFEKKNSNDSCVYAPIYHKSIIFKSKPCRGQTPPKILKKI